jgi:hypothetical protein
MHRCVRFGLLVAVALMFPAVARAQPAWDSPMLMPPRLSDGLGLHVLDAHAGGVGAMLTWRAPRWNFGVRAGLVDGQRDDIGLIGGIDVSGGLTRSSDEFPIDIDWVFGAGLGIDDGARVSLPLGLSIGHVFEGDGATFVPYATPRVILDAFIGDDDDDDDDDRGRRGRDDVRLGVAVDLGLDLRVTSAFLIRFAATVGDREAVSLGLVF